MRSAERHLARGIRAALRRHDERRGRHVARGRIITLNPLGVDLLESDLTLDEDDIDLSQDVRRYDATEGLAVDDVLALLEVAEGDWIAVSVLSDHAVEPAGP